MLIQWSCVVITEAVQPIILYRKRLPTSVLYLSPWVAPEVTCRELLYMPRMFSLPGMFSGCTQDLVYHKQKGQGISAPWPPSPEEGWELVYRYPSFFTFCQDNLKMLHLVSSPWVPVQAPLFPVSLSLLHQSGDRNPTRDVNREN